MLIFTLKPGILSSILFNTYSYRDINDIVQSAGLIVFYGSFPSKKIKTIDRKTNGSPGPLF